MISFDGVQKSEIRNHYELATLFYRLLWGQHIHHGLWNSNKDSSGAAQRQLIEHLVFQSGITRGADVLDVGCGMGGSSIYLARNYHCRVTGVTLSGLQRRWAGASAWLHGVGSRTDFVRGDAEQVEFPEAAFDYLWSVECTEHLFDKPAFFERAVHWLKPGGGVALCVWHAGDPPHSAEDIRQVHAVCDAFLCPSLGSVKDYRQWLGAAGLHVTCVTDLTDRVTRTWEICKQRVQRSGAGWLSPLLGHKMVRFVENFDTILRAYRSGSMKYCSIVARKSVDDGGFDHQTGAEA
jgi:tocopherol O-methyltransferase